MIKKLMLLGVAIALMSAPASAQITLWTFEGDTTVPEIGAGTVTYNATWAGNENFFAGNPGRAWSISPFTNVVGTIGPGNPPDKESYVQFTTSTAGYQEISVSWDQRTTSTGPATFTFQYTADGSTWVDHVVLQSVLSAQWESFSVDLSGISAVEDNPNFAFRIAATINPDTNNYTGPTGANPGTGGNWRFDNVTVVPEPGSMMALAAGLTGMAGMVLRRRR